ncbi:Ig-like domain-containing protein [Corynebacterium sp. P3-F1]|uniref:L,D-transpeptidase n=1 Tax=Corynebacterium sp. P3-F1 TaxID=3059080 RepID=UPI00265CE579|nr:Ig-like domain-containing protein [Corynebacterium sp. P3-F1]WKK62047.1 Ig-like domain-containing protein [Corynebacterium sp. P3-F1]
MTENSVSRWRRLIAAGAALMLVGGTVAACTIDRPENVADSESAEQEKHDPAVISVADGAEDVEPSDPVTVSAPDGLESVSMKNEEGREVEAEFNPDKTEWTTTEPLGYGREYTVEAVTVNGETSQSVFTTVVPDGQISAYIGPLDGSEVGVAHAVNVYFDSAPADRQAIQDAITIETSNDTEGAFYWLDSQHLIWRPKEYWVPGTEVTVTADIYGKSFGDGIYGAEDAKSTFTIGDLVKAVVDDNTKTLTVYHNDEEMRSFPVSLGRDGEFATPNGLYVVGDRNESMTMDSTTYGLALENGGYRTSVNYATQMSWSGIYVHSAPWAIGALGSYNQSHGCVNATPDDAQWFMNYVKPGDPVEVVNTSGGTLQGLDGLGYWNLDWETLKAGNVDEG